MNLSSVYSSTTAVTLQFVSHNFLDYHDPTIGELVFLISSHYAQVISNPHIPTYTRRRLVPAAGRH